VEIVPALSISFAHTGRLVDAVRTDQLDAATPCAEWDVRALLAHMIGVVANMGHGVRGEPVGDPGATEVDDVPGPQFAAVAGATLAAWRTADLGASVEIGAGPMPALVAAKINLLDTTVHAWDLARATGQDAELPAAVAAAALDAAHEVVSDASRGLAGVAPAIDPGPDPGPTDALVAYLGRRP